MAAMYKVLVVFTDDRKLYLGEHRFNGDAWQELDKVVRKHVEQDDLDKVVSTRGYRDNLPNYSSITDARTFDEVACGPGSNG